MRSDESYVKCVNFQQIANETQAKKKAQEERKRKKETTEKAQRYLFVWIESSGSLYKGFCQTPILCHTHECKRNQKGKHNLR